MQTATGALVGPDHPRATTLGPDDNVGVGSSAQASGRPGSAISRGRTVSQLKTTIGPDTGLPCFKGGQTLPLVHHKEEKFTWQS